MEKHLSRPKSWEHLSSKDFVAAYDRWAQKELKGYSRRAFARWARISSPNFLTLVIQGKRPLHQGWLEGFTSAAKLDALEKNFLKLLLNFEQESNGPTKSAVYDQLLTLLQRQSLHSLASDQLELVRNPLAWTLYHMLGLADQQGTPKWFKKRLRSAHKVPEIQAALDLIERVGLAVRQADGRYAAKSAQVQSPDQMRAQENTRFHKHALQEAGQALDTLNPADRSFGSLTVAVDEKDLASIKAEINKFGQQLMSKYGKAHPVHGELFRMNIQLYPLTQTPADSGDSQ